MFVKKHDKPYFKKAFYVVLTTVSLESSVTLVLRRRVLPFVVAWRQGGFSLRMRELQKGGFFQLNTRVYSVLIIFDMYIKSVVIDGFKSYAQRTEIFGFDPMFNAITGLNGSGKSNILDSICFLLGISNLSQVNIDHLSLLSFLCPALFFFCLLAYINTRQIQAYSYAI